MMARCSFEESIYSALRLGAWFVLIFLIGCGGGSVTPAATLASANPAPTGSTPGPASGGSAGSGSAAGSGGSSSGSGGPTSGPASTGFLYVGLDDSFSMYSNIAQTGHPSIAGFAIASDGSLQATPGSPYQSPAAALAVNPGASTLYTASGSTLNVDHINGDGSLSTTSTLSAQPLSPSPGIYTDLSLNVSTQTLYATAIHGAGTNFFEIYNSGGDGSLAGSGSQSNTVSPSHPHFTADGKRAFQSYCYHLDGALLGYNVGADGKLTGFDTRTTIATFDGSSTPCPHGLAISPDGKYLAAPLNGVTTQQSALGIWSIQSDGTLAAQSGSPYARTAPASDIAWDASGRYIAMAAKDGLWIYSLAAGAAPVPLGAAPVVNASIDHVAFNKAGTLLFATSAGAHNVYAFTFNSGSGTISPAPGSPHSVNLAPYELVTSER